MDSQATVGITGPVTAGLVIIALFFGGFGGWAALAPLESAAIAQGVVSVESNRKTVQHLEGGIIQEILVRDGDVVVLDQLLVRLDDTQPRASLDLLHGRRNAAAALAARLSAERDRMDAVAFPDWLLALADDADVLQALEGEFNIFAARRDTMAGQVAVLNARIAAFAEEIKGLEGEITAGDTQHGLILEEIAPVDALVKKGLERKPRLLALQRRAAEIEGARGTSRARIARANQSIGEARLRISELATARINEVVEQLREVQSSLFDIAERINAARDVLGRTEIRATQAGTVVDLKVHTKGGVIAPGAALLDIVPGADELIIEARIDPKDIDVVSWGLLARVRFTAFSQRNAVPMDGRVISVSADNLVDERSGEAYYLARIRLDKDPAEVMEGLRLYPGMQAEVMIVTGSRTALEYIMSPVSRSIDRALRED